MQYVATREQPTSDEADGGAGLEESGRGAVAEGDWFRRVGCFGRDSFGGGESYASGRLPKTWRSVQN